MKKASPAVATTANLPALQAADPVGKMLWNKHHFAVQMVDPKAFNASNLGDLESIEADVIDRLAADGYTDIDAAFRALVGTFGISRYSNKAALAEEGTPFYIEQIVMRSGGGYKGEDDWALRIVTAEDGEPQVLTMESNPGRDRFLYTLAFAQSRFGKRPTAALSRIDKKDGTGFYVIGPASIGRNNLRNVTKDVAADPDTLEGQIIE